MIRICPKRDAACPHGMGCPYSDGYDCLPETPSAASPEAPEDVAGVEPVAWRWAKIGRTDVDDWEYQYGHPQMPDTHYVTEPVYSASALARVAAELDDYKGAAETLGSQLASTIAEASTLRAENEALRAEATRLCGELARVERETIERAVVAGWNACRKSIYAVCEDVEAEADRIRVVSTVGSASEEQHAKGYHAGTCRAAKSIARGFNSMEALDDDNCTTAIRTLEPHHD